MSFTETEAFMVLIALALGLHMIYSWIIRLQSEIWQRLISLTNKTNYPLQAKSYLFRQGECIARTACLLVSCTYLFLHLALMARFGLVVLPLFNLALTLIATLVLVGVGCSILGVHYEKKSEGAFKHN